MINVVLFHLDDYTKLTTAIEILTNESAPQWLLASRKYGGFTKSNPSFLDSISNGGYLTVENAEALFRLNNEGNCIRGIIV